MLKFLKGMKNMDNKIKIAVNYYKLCTKLKDTIRTGPIV